MLTEAQNQGGKKKEEGCTGKVLGVQRFLGEKITTEGGKNVQEGSL